MNNIKEIAQHNSVAWGEIAGKIDENFTGVESSLSNLQGGQVNLSNTKVDKVTGKGLSTEDYTTAEKAKLNTLANVAVSGSYTDLINVPEMPVVNNATLTISMNDESLGTWNSNSAEDKTINIQVSKHNVGLSNVDNTADIDKPISKAMQDALDAKVNGVAIKQVAFTGQYEDLEGKPEINNGLLTITRNEQTVGTFNANQPNASTINIDVPTQVSELVNDRGYLTEHQSITHLAIEEEVASRLANKVDKVSGKDLSTNDFTNELKTKLEGLQNYDDDAVKDSISSIQESLATVATSGNYNDLSNTPDGVLSIAKNGVVIDNFSVEATENKTIDIILSKADVGLNNVDNTSDENKPISKATQSALDLKADSAILSAVAKSGSYNDLTNTPEIPVVHDNTLTIQKNGTNVGSWTGNSVDNKTINIEVTKSDVGLSNVDNTSDAAKPISEATQEALDLKANINDLANVATSGSYNDLEDKPAINEGLLTITRNNESIGTFSANQASAATINVVVPEKVSDLVNDANYINQHQDISHLAEKEAVASDLNTKVDKVEGMGLSANNFTDELKSKLESLENYNDNTVQTSISGLQDQINALVGTNANEAIESFNEIIAFLAGIEDTETLDGIIAGINEEIAKKANTSSLAGVATSGSYNDLSDKPFIPVVNNGVLTIQKNGVTIDTFSADASANKTINIQLTKSDVGLSNVDNTSDADKPISNATQAALDTKQANLVSGTNIKTVNGESVLGSGDINVGVLSIKGSAESTYRSGNNINITPANLGITVVNNTTDANKTVKHASTAGTATNLADAPIIEASGNNITVKAGNKTSEAFTVPYATSANTATNLDAAPSFTAKTNKITVTVGGKTSEEFTVPFATSATSATKATQDGGGNVIANTYATKTEVGKKQDTISDLADIRSGANLGATAVQPTSLASVATSGSFTDLSNKPTIDTALSTTSTNAVQNKVIAAGINAKYAKPSTGIPKTDLASAVQTSLGKADTALQIESDPIFSASAAASITTSDISNWNSKTSNVGTITGIKMNGESMGTSGVIDLGTIITAHQSISHKLDSSVAASTYLTINDAASNYLGKSANAVSATKATQDGSGNVIVDTYATKTALNAKLDSATATSTYLSKTDAASTYLGKTAKAASAATADSATKATQDGSGNVITSTYATIAALNSALGGKVSASGVTEVKALTQAQYNALSSKNATTLYIVTD